MKLSLMIPTFRSADTIERTLRSALAQRYRPLELVVYDETSADGTREIVEKIVCDGSISRTGTFPLRLSLSSAMYAANS